MQCQDHFDVVKIEAPFPVSSEYAASADADFDKDISEFSVCYRMMIESYNDGYINIIYANFTGKKLETWDQRTYMNRIGKDVGWTLDGFQEAFIHLTRNIPGGGLGKQTFPFWHHLNFPENVRLSEWYSFCTSYSSSLHRIHQYQNGIKVFGFTYLDEVEDPLPSDTFKNLLIGSNLRGFITDINIYSYFFEEDAMVEWTRGCAQKKGDIFAWNTTNLNTALEEKMNVTIVSVDKKDICMDPNKKIKPQRPDLSGKTSIGNRFKPKPQEQSLSDSVLELMTDPLNTKTAFQARDLCYRLNGEILQRPQTEEEVSLMDKVLWDFMMTKTSKNLTFINEKHKVTDIWVGGESYLSEEENSKDLSLYGNGTRENVFPESGHFQMFHSSTGEPLEDIGIQIPYHGTDPRGGHQCVLCFSHMKEPVPGHSWLDRPDPWCHYTSCYDERIISTICVFPDVPTFKIRGLCKSATMDKEYRIAKHKLMDLNAELSLQRWGLDNMRSYMGPKGWVISVNQTDKSWIISHYHYPDLTLTMVDPDTLPFGRHKWLIENNVCSQGKTSIQVLQISGCSEEQFTCDDGKCLDISQRCNNVEVGIDISGGVSCC